MDFENFNFDSILDDYLNDGGNDSTPVDSDGQENDLPFEPEPVAMPEPDWQPEENTEPEEPGKPERRKPEPVRRPKSIPEDIPVRKRSSSQSSSGQRKNPDVPVRSKTKSVDRQTVRETREAERRAEKRRKVLEKKADQRLIEKQRLEEERERVSTREYMEEERAARKARDVEGRRKSRIGTITFFLVLAVLIAGLVFASKTVASSNKTMPNLFVGNIPIGRMTQEEALAQLNANGWTDRTSSPVTVSTFGDLQISIDPIQAGAVIPAEEAVAKAYAFGRDGNMFSMLFKYIDSLTKPVDINDANTALKEDYIQNEISALQTQLSDYVGTEPYIVDYDKGELRAVKGAGNLELEPVGLYNEIVSALKTGRKEIVYQVVSREPIMPDFTEIHSQIAAEVVDAKYSDDGRYEVIDDTVGCDFDVSEAANIWMSSGIAETAVVPLKITRPNVTGDELRSRLYNDLLGTMTTYFPLSTDDRINNVNLAASKLNGLILYPGDLFSYNGTVGERTEEAGFKYAAAYSDGEVVEELGGGICQVASTLYCASLYARLETVERTCHMFEVQYMDQLGLDATCSWPDPDLKLRNNKEYPIKIVTKCDTAEKSLTIELWGTAEDDYTVELKTDKYQYTNADGAWVGWRTVTYRYLYDANGNVVPVPDKDGNMVQYEYTYTDENGKPLMDTYLFHTN